MNYKHNFLTQEVPFFVLSIVGQATNLPRSHFLMWAGGVVLKFYFNSNWDDSRVLVLWLNWTFKIMGNYCSDCGKTATEGNYCRGCYERQFPVCEHCKKPILPGEEVFGDCHKNPCYDSKHPPPLRLKVKRGDTSIKVYSNKEPNQKMLGLTDGRLQFNEPHQHMLILRSS